MINLDLRDIGDAIVDLKVTGDHVSALSNLLALAEAGLTGVKEVPSLYDEQDDDIWKTSKLVREYRPNLIGALSDDLLETFTNYKEPWRPWQQLAISNFSCLRLSHFWYFRRRAMFCSEAVIAILPVFEFWSKIPPKNDSLDGGIYHAFDFVRITAQAAQSANAPMNSIIIMK